MANRDAGNKVNDLKSQVAALNDLLTQREKAIRDQSAGFGQALLELTRSQSLWHDTFDAIPDMAFIVDKEQRVVAANRAMCEAFAGRQVIGAHCYELIHGADAPPSACPGHETCRTGKPAHREFLEPHLGDRWLDVHTFPIKDKGLVEQVGHVVRDITKPKRAEEALRQSEEQYRALVETTDTGYVILDQEGKVLDANPEYVRLSGHRNLEEIRGRNVI